jgi:hypothetical protein
METLQLLMLENELDEHKATILALHKLYRTETKKALTEGVLDFDSNDLDFMFDEAKKRFQAAKRGVQIANKLADPEQKRRVFSNMNKLRAFIARLTKTIQQDLDVLQNQLKGGQGLSQQRPVPQTPSNLGRQQGKTFENPPQQVV